MKIDDRSRIDALRHVEALVFTHCSFLLSEESAAVSAAKTVLLDLYADESFWRTEGTEREKFAKKRSISISLKIAARNRQRKSPATSLG